MMFLNLRVILYFEKVCTSDKVINFLNSKQSHILTKFLRNKLHKVLNIFRLSFKSLSEFRILCCYTYRTCIKITYTHHYTTHCYKRCCCKTIFLCPKKCSHKYITACHKFTVCLNADTRTKSVHYKCLVCLSKTEFPRKTCIIN